MNKLFSVLSILMLAVVLSSGRKIRLFSPRAGARIRTIPLSQLNSLQYPIGLQGLSGLSYFPTRGNFINQHMAFNSPLIGGRRMMPDGEYRTAHGIATVDGSDFSLDAY